MAVMEGSISVLSALSTLFYVSKGFGIIPHDLLNYYHNKLLSKSLWGTLWVIVSAFAYAGQYHMVMNVYFATENVQQTSTLTLAIGVFITYMGPMMMFMDLAVGLYNQKKLIGLFDRVKSLDENLIRESIFVNNSKLRTNINIFVGIVFSGECLLILLNYFIFFEDSSLYLTLVGGIPVLISTIEKVWFIGLTLILKNRFSMINKYLRFTVKFYLEKKKASEIFSLDYNINYGYLHKEIVHKTSTPSLPFGLKKNKIIAVQPWDEISGSNKLVRNVNKEKETSSTLSELEDITKTEVKLNVLCELHDEICEIGKCVNRMWSLQMLILMAYGFMSITAQFYFLYCFLVDQAYPAMFKSAGSITISMIFIIYTASKCVCVIYLSWQTKLESQKTGVCLHKIGNAIDENSFYEIVNHLSLKLLNHNVNFTACGFFNLDMTTLYSVTGAITTYLIILIQFNLAAHRTKKPDDPNATTTPAQ